MTHQEHINKVHKRYDDFNRKLKYSKEKEILVCNYYRLCVLTDAIVNKYQSQGIVLNINESRVNHCDTIEQLSSYLLDSINKEDGSELYWINELRKFILK